MKRKLFSLAAILTFACLPLAGCGGPSTTNVTEDADAEALAEYDRLIEEEQRALGVEMESGLDD